MGSFTTMSSHNLYTGLWWEASLQCCHTTYIQDYDGKLKNNVVIQPIYRKIMGSFTTMSSYNLYTGLWREAKKQCRLHTTYIQDYDGKLHNNVVINLYTGLWLEASLQCRLTTYIQDNDGKLHYNVVLQPIYRIMMGSFTTMSSYNLYTG